MAFDRFPAYLTLIAPSDRPADTSADRRPAGAPAIASRDALLDRLETVGELAPVAALSFVLVKVTGLDALGRDHGEDAVDGLLGAVSSELLNLTRPTDMVGRFSGSTFAVVLQGTGPTAAGAVSARLSHHLGRLTRPGSPARVMVTVATGRGLNWDMLPPAAMDSIEVVS